MDIENLIKSNPEKAIQQIVNNLVNAKDDVQKATNFYYLGLANLKLHDYDIANDNLNKAIKLFDDLNDEKNIANCLVALGKMYEKLWDYDKALASFYQANQTYNKLKLSLDIAITCLNIGKVLGLQKQYKQANEFLQKSLKILKNSQYFYETANCYNALALICKQQQQFAKANNYYKKAILILQNSKSFDYAKLCIKYAELKILQKQYKLANELLTDALDIIKIKNIKNLEVRIWKVWANMHEAKKHFKKAFICYKNYVNLNNEKFTEEATKRFTRMQVYYETEKKEKEKEIYRLKNIELAKANETINKKNSLLLDAYKKLDKTSRTDPLTGLSNRRDFSEKFLQEQVRFRRNMRDFCIILCDIDFFKKFNDTYGHNCGDFVLAKMSKLIRTNLRDQDILARWGGEEFIMLLPETNIYGGKTVAEKIRKSIEENILIYEEKKLKVTFTFGVACYNKVMPMEEIVKMADDALYAGKEQGRNIVMIVRESMFTKKIEK